MGFITIPNTLGGAPVTSIGDSAFVYCNGLTSISIPQGVTNIGHNSFFNCIGLTSISIPQRVTSIGHSAFYGCTRLTTITFNSAATTIFDSADTIPDTTKIIGHTSSTAKTYATKYNREFEVIVATNKLNKKVTTINVGATETLSAIISPSNATNKNVTWERVTLPSQQFLHRA